MPVDVRSFLEKPDIAVQKEKFIKKSEASEKGAPPDKARFEAALSEFLREVASLRKTAEDGKRICENALADGGATKSRAPTGCAAHISDMYTISDGNAEHSVTLRALADIDTAILKSGVKDAVSLALQKGRCFAGLGESDDKTKDAFRKSLLRSHLVYEELERAASECEKYFQSFH